MTEVKRVFPLHDGNKLEMHIRVLIGEAYTQIDVEYLTDTGERCVWAGHVSRHIHQDSADNTFVGYHGEFTYEEYNYGLKYVELAYAVTQLQLYDITTNPKEIVNLIINMQFLY